MTFKHVDDRHMKMDIMGMVERPICRADRTDYESRTLALLEDPIEFAQNIARVLEGGDLQGLLSPNLPIMAERNIDDLRRIAHQAIARRDWVAATKIMYTLDDEINSAENDACEYGVAIGALMEQLRMGLVDLARLRYAGKTHHNATVADKIAELRTMVDATKPAEG